MGARRPPFLLRATVWVLILALTAGGAAGWQEAVQEPPGVGLEGPLAAEVEALRTEVERLSAVTERLEASAQAADSAAEPGGVGALLEGGADLGQATESARRWGVQSVMAVVLLVLTHFAIRGASWILIRLAERNARRRLLFLRLEPIVRTAFWTFAIFIVLRAVFRIDATTLLAAGAALGVAVGFAAQDILKNIFGGLVILADGPFQVGDKISVAGTYGEVSAIGTRSTRIVTPDDNLVSVPNSQIVEQQVSNANAGALDCQVVTDLYLPGWVDVKLARDLAYRAAITSRYVYRRKPVVVLVRDELRDTFVTHLRVKAYVLDIRFEFAFMSDVTERARDAFREAGLIPPWLGAKPYLRVDPVGSFPAPASGS